MVHRKITFDKGTSAMAGWMPTTIQRETPTMNTSELSQSILRHLEFSQGKDLSHASIYDMRMALTLAIRDKVIEPWFRATRATYAAQSKRVYYLSMEFLIGRLLEDAILNLGLTESADTALRGLGHDLRAVLDDEPDAALGNGGLGRLAACFLDSMSTLGCPAYGYGIRYEHGLFRQSFVKAARSKRPRIGCASATAGNSSAPRRRSGSALAARCAKMAKPRSGTPPMP
jgi:glycogen phosphorylase